MLIWAADLEAEMHFENLMDEEDERREKEVEMRRIEALEQGQGRSNSTASTVAEGVEVGSPMHPHGQAHSVYNLDYTRKAQDRGAGAAAPPAPSATATAQTRVAAALTARCPGTRPVLQHHSRRRQPGTEYRRAGSGVWRASVLQDALKAEAGAVEEERRAAQALTGGRGRGRTGRTETEAEAEAEATRVRRAAAMQRREPGGHAPVRHGGSVGDAFLREMQERQRQPSV